MRSSRPVFKVHFLTAFLFVTCAFSATRGAQGDDYEYLDKTFYVVFDGYEDNDGAVVTGRFAGWAECFERTEGGTLSLGDVDEASVTLTTSNGSESWDYPADPTSLTGFRFSYGYDLFNNVIVASDFSIVLGIFSLGTHNSGETLWYETWDDSGRRGYAELRNAVFADTEDSASPGWLGVYIAAGADNSQIDNAGVANSLLTMAEAAGAADANDNTQAAVKILEAFIHRVEVQSGRQIDPSMADLLIYEATNVIDDLLAE